MKPKAYRDRMDQIRNESAQSPADDAIGGAADSQGLDLAGPEMTTEPPSASSAVAQMEEPAASPAETSAPWCERCKAPAVTGKPGVPYKCAQCHDVF